MSAVPLIDLRHLVIDELAHGWVTPTGLANRLGLHDRNRDRVALVLERLAHEGVAELWNPASRRARWFRKADTANCSCIECGPPIARPRPSRQAA